VKLLVGFLVIGRFQVKAIFGIDYCEKESIFLTQFELNNKDKH
jgi:hypothetical protein